MEKKLTIHYYEEGDELNVLVGKPTEVQARLKLALAVP
jgi:hypothetical protein